MIAILGYIPLKLICRRLMVIAVVCMKVGHADDKILSHFQAWSTNQFVFVVVIVAYIGGAVATA